jgi:Methane oxygenase PmoA
MKQTSRVALAALAGAFALCAQVKISQGNNKISIGIHGQPYSDFYIAGPDPSFPGADKSLTGADLMKPFLWPIRAATGTVITRAWPLVQTDEEKDLKGDHPHQRGIWFGHENVNGSDFWNSYTAKNRGKITLIKVGELQSGKDSGSLAAKFQWTGNDGTPVLTESRVMTFHDQPNLRTIDFDITLTAIDKVKFGDAKDGAFGMRLRPVLQEDKGMGRIVNADGSATEKAVWAKPSNWCDYSGEINGEKVGVAILNHPANAGGRPVRWHVRAYGLFAANPFALGLAGFTNDKSQDGSKTLEPGESFRFRYRVIVHPGDAKTADVAGEWAKYSK